MPIDRVPDRVRSGSVVPSLCALANWVLPMKWSDNPFYFLLMGFAPALFFFATGNTFLGLLGIPAGLLFVFLVQRRSQQGPKDER